MPNWGQDVLNAAFDKLAGGGKFGKLSATYGEDFDPESVDVQTIPNIPDSVFTWPDDGKRYMFTDSGAEVPNGVTGMPVQDFLDMMGDLPIVPMASEE